MARIGVEINPEKPRRGTFEVRLRSAASEPAIIISTLDRSRPFTNVKALDMDAVASEARSAIQSMLEQQLDD